MSDNPRWLDELRSAEWCAFLALGETLPVGARLRVALMGANHVSPEPTLLAALEVAIAKQPPRVRALTGITNIDYSWAAFLEAWLSGDDDRRWASEPERKCRQARFLGEMPQASDKALVDILILRGAIDEHLADGQLGLTDDIASRVSQALHSGVLDGLRNQSSLLCYLVEKRIGDLYLLDDREAEARAAYRAARTILESECDREVRAHYLPANILSELWLEPDPSVWRPWLDSMREFYAHDGIAGAIESVRWRKEYDHDAEHSKWLSVSRQASYPVELSHSHEWCHIERVSERAGSLMDTGAPAASAVTECAIRLACTTGSFTMLPELASYKARQSLADGDLLLAAQRHIRSGRAQFFRDIKQSDANTVSRLASVVAQNAVALRACSEVGRDRVFRVSTYTHLLSALVSDDRIELGLRATLLPEMLRLMSEGRSAMLVSVDVARSAAEAVLEFVGAAGPTILEPYNGAIARVSLDRLKDHDWRLNDHVLRILFTMMHVDSYGRRYGDVTVEAIVSHLEALPKPGEPWPVVLPAFAVIAGVSVLNRVASSADIGARIIAQAKRHFGPSAIISRLHPDLPIRILRALEPGATEIARLAEEAIAETRAQSSESMRVLRKLVGEAGVDDVETLTRIAVAAAHIIAWRSNSGDLAMSISSAPHLIYDLVSKELPTTAYMQLWVSVSRVMEECCTSPTRLYFFDDEEENRVIVANWTTAFIVLSNRVGESHVSDRCLTSIAAYSPFMASAVLLGRIYAKKDDVAILETTGSAAEFYACLPYFLARGTYRSKSDIGLMINAILRYGPRAEDLGVLTLAVWVVGPSSIADVPQQTILDYRWRLEAMGELIQAQLRPLLEKLRASS